MSMRHRQLASDYRQFIEQGGKEALHDFRVSLRRLRSLLSNYRKVLPRNDELVDRLRTLQRQTNPARDLEVFIAQLRNCKAEDSPPGVALQQQLQEEYQQLRQTLPTIWDELAPTMAKQAALPPVADADTTLARLSAKLGRKQYKRLRQGLRQLHRHWDDGLAHKQRICGKKLRYLLETFAGESKPIARAIKTLKRFQDELGDYHDLQLLQQHLLSANMESSALPGNALTAAIEERLRTQRKTAKRYRKGKRYKVLLRRIRRALQALER